jgi:hypothetical protein
LISVGQLDENGFTVTFGNSKCVIHDSDSHLVGEIPKSKKGLYKNISDSVDSANAVNEELTVEKFYHQMGHIAPDVACHLMQNGFVTGIKLDMTLNRDPFFCDSCVYAKATRKKIGKVKQGE